MIKAKFVTSYASGVTDIFQIENRVVLGRIVSADSFFRAGEYINFSIDEIDKNDVIDFLFKYKNQHIKWYIEGKLNKIDAGKVEQEIKEAKSKNIEYKDFYLMLLFIGKNYYE